MTRPAVIDTASVGAVLFDMDGVLTDTASVHFAAWSHLFDEALQGVVKFPVRIKCATLSWNTLAQAIEESEG